jgi:hypothetical protein
MKRPVVVGFCIVVGAELIALLLLERRFVGLAAAAAGALALLAVRSYLVGEPDPEPVDGPSNDAAESLRRWLSRTQTLLSWSESTRRDWDRHLRPMLARQFEMATGQKQAKDRAAFHATGQMLFGDQLWAWVDPQNVARSGGREPGPGRVALNEILQRLEQL